MRAMGSLITLLGLIMILGCDKEETKETEEAVTVSQGTIGSAASVTLTGSLDIAMPEGSSQQAANFVAEQPVQIMDEYNEVVAETTTASGGSFAISVSDKASLVATSEGGDNNQSQMLMYQYHVRGLIKSGPEEKVYGVRKSLVFSSQSLISDGQGGFKYHSGKHQAKKIGAIKGKVTLEGGEEPVGIDVYVPGTSHTAKTDQKGEFILSFLTAGIYTIRVEKDGYGAFYVYDVEVKKADTAVIEKPIVLKISEGPQILALVTSDGQSYTTSSALVLHLTTKGAIKYKLDTFADYRYATKYQPIDQAADPFVIQLVLPGGDGEKTVYLKVADPDGIEVEQALTIRLDTQPPSAPNFTIYSEKQRISGYTGSAAVMITPDSCEDVANLYLTEDASKIPVAEDFTSACQTTAVTLSSEDGLKTLYLWAIDPIGQIGAQPSSQVVALDQSQPTLTVSELSGKFNKSITVFASTDEDPAEGEDADKIAIFYTIDGSDPSSQDARFGKQLALIGSTNLKMVAIDGADNQSDIFSADFIIDREGPILGTIDITQTVLNGNASPVNASINLSAINADFFMLSEQKDFSGATWVAYQTTAQYTVSSGEGEKTIYAKFKDAAGNEIGQNGDIYDTVNVDTQDPSISGLFLYYPETPTGSFANSLGWAYASDDAVSYEVKVFLEGAVSCPGTLLHSVEKGYGQAIDQNFWKISPPLTQEGCYSWKIRIKDAAGNFSEWVEAGPSKTFTIKVLRKDFKAAYTFRGQEIARNIGSNMLPLATVPGESDPMIMVTIPKVCIDKAQCDQFTQDNSTYVGGAAGQTTEEMVPPTSVVKILRPDYTEYATFDEQLPFQYSFGKEMLTCDGVKDYVIAAPRESWFVTETIVGGDAVARQREYKGVGKIYVYDGTTRAKLLTYAEDISGNTAGNLRRKGYTCNQYYPNNWTECKSYGYDSTDNAAAATATMDSSSRLTGNSMTCLPTAEDGDGADNRDRLLFGVPTFNDPTGGEYDNMGRGKAVILTYNVASSPKYSLVEIAGTTDYAYFGSKVVYVGKIKAPDAAGDKTGVYAITSPQEQVSGAYNAGKVRFYSGYGTPTLLFSIEGDSNDAKFGSNMITVGTNVFDATDDTYTDFIISERTWQTAKIHFFSGDLNATNDPLTPTNAAGTLTKSFCGNNGCFGTDFGSYLYAVGDVNGDNQADFAVADPSESLGTVWQSGKVYVYQAKNYGNAAFSTPLYTMTEDIEGYQNFGSYVAGGVDFDGDGKDDMLIGAQAKKNSEFKEAGIVYHYQDTELAPGSPSSVVGQSTSDEYGTAIAILQDIDGDGVGDIAVSAPNAKYQGRTGAGRVDFISGVDRSIIYSIGGSTFGENFGYQMKVFAGESHKRFLAISAPSKAFGGDNKCGQVYLYDALYRSFVDDGTLDTAAGNTISAGALVNKDFSGTPNENCSSDNDDYRYGISLDVAFYSGAYYLAYGGPNDYDFGSSYVKVFKVVFVADSTSNATITRFPINGGSDMDIGGYGTGSGMGVDFGQSLAFVSNLVPGVDLSLVVGDPKQGNQGDTKGRIWFFAVDTATSKIKAMDSSNDTDNCLTLPSDASSGNCLSYEADTSGDYDGLGNTVVSVGDIDNDGYGDFAVSNLNAASDLSSKSEVLILGVKASGTDADPFTLVKIFHERGAANEGFGTYIQSLGNFNKGLAPAINDFAIVKAGGQGKVSSSSGSIFLYSGEAVYTNYTTAVGGSATNAAPAPGQSVNADAIMHTFYNEESQKTAFGNNVAVGDINGDNVDDLVIGAPKYDNGGQADIGKIYIFKLEGVSNSK